MWLFKSVDKKSENILYVSIDGRSIGIAFYTGMVCHYSERRIHITGETDRPIEELFKDIIHGFKKTNSSFIDEIIVILESPWVREIPATIKEKRNKSWLIGKDTISDLIHKDKNLVAKDSNFGQDLGYQIESIKLNGYTYAEPVGKITEEIQIEITRFLGDKDIIELTTKIIKDFWNKTKISYVSGAEYLFEIAKSRNTVSDIYISLNTTDTCIRIYSQGIVNKKIIIPFGFQNILEKLGSIWNTTSSETKHWLNLFIENSLSTEENKRIQNDITGIISKMLTLMKNTEKNGIILGLERPMVIYGIDQTWNKLFIFLLKNRFFGEIFPHIENTKITDLSSEIQDSKGDLLLALYINIIFKKYAKTSN